MWSLGVKKARWRCCFNYVVTQGKESQVEVLLQLCGHSGYRKPGRGVASIMWSLRVKKARWRCSSIMWSLRVKKARWRCCFNYVVTRGTESQVEVLLQLCGHSG